jgi:hypothetical protein
MLSTPSTILPLIIILTSLLTPIYATPTPEPTSVWAINIDNGPAPPPEEGPPLSAHATRDPALLKYQITGIVAAYLCCLFAVTILVTYGRRLRRKQLSSDQSLSMEMVKPAAKVNQAALGTGPSPISPRKEGFRPWVSPAQGHQHKQSQVSVSTVDEKVVEAHKARDMDDLEKLYAAVLLQDEQSSHHARVGSRGDQTQTSSVYSQGPAELQHLGNIGQAVPLSPTSPVPGVNPTPIEENFQTTTAKSSPPPKAVRASPKPLTFAGHNRIGSENSARSRPSKISVRGREISTPMGSADLRESAAYSDEAPLSPRLYTPGPPPPTPGHKSAAAQAREVDGQRHSRFHLPSAISNIGRNTPTATNSTGSLPFRQNYSDSMKSAPATKTTFLDKRENLLHSGPKTGVPFTPYSPYMPYTPLTPVTPRVLIGKDERKRKQKKAAMKVVTEDDLVASDDDMWSTTR